MRHLVVSLVLALGLAACSGDDVSQEEQACRDFVDTYVDHAVDDCMLGSRAQVEASVSAGLQMAGINGCGDVDQIRDIDQFYGECLPELEAFPCDQLTTGLPASCNMQLQVVVR